MNGVALFLHLAALGTVTTAAFLPHRRIGFGRLRFHALQALLFAFAAIALGRPWEAFAADLFIAKLVSGMGMLFTVGVLIFFVVALGARREIRMDALLFPVPLGISFVALTAFEATPYGAGNALLLMVHCLLGSAALGSGLVACTSAFGTFPQESLVRLVRVFMWIMIARCLLGGGCYFLKLGDLPLRDQSLMLCFVAAILASAGFNAAKRGSSRYAAGVLITGMLSLVAAEIVSG